MQCYDLFGMGSCSDMSSNGGGEIDLEQRTDFISTKRPGNRHRRRTRERREFSPPLSILSQTDKAPWVLRRYHTDDGRLILREERAPRQCYFEASRSNGRLRLQLFLVEDAVYEESESEEEEGTGISAGGGLGVGVGGKCMDYNSTCFLRMPVLPIRTVHI